MVGQYQSRSGVFGPDMVRRSRLGSVCSGASGYGKSCFGGAAQGGLGGVRHRLFWLGGLAMARHGNAGHGSAR